MKVGLNVEEICSILKPSDIPEIQYDTENAERRFFYCSFKSGMNYGINIKSGNISELVNIIKSDEELCIGYETIMNEIYKVDLDTDNTKVPEDVMFCVFCFLHEVGHWLDFKKSGSNAKEYMKEYALCKEVLNEEREGDLSKACGYEIIKVKKRYAIQYRGLPNEKIADEYAKSKINEALTILRSAL